MIPIPKPAYFSDSPEFSILSLNILKLYSSSFFRGSFGCVTFVTKSKTLFRVKVIALKFAIAVAWKKNNEKLKKRQCNPPPLNKDDNIHKNEA